MSARRVAVAVALLSLLGLLAVRAGVGGPPLYDGVCLPHHYLKLGGTPPPSSASKAIPVSTDFPITQLATPDLQAQLILASSSFAVPAGSTVTVTIAPVPPPSVTPDGPIDGNVYDFSATGPGGQPLSLSPGHPATVVLQATAAGGPALVVEHFDGAHWTALRSFQSGCGDTEEAASPTLGMFALVAKGATVTPGVGSGGGTGGGGGGSPALVILVAVLGLAIVVAAVAVASRRRR